MMSAEYLGGGGAADHADKAVAASERVSGFSNLLVSIRLQSPPDVADMRVEEVPSYDDLINFSRARDKEQVCLPACRRISSRRG